MDIVDMLMRAQGGNALENMGKRVGLDAGQTQSAVEQLAPMIAAGLRRNAGNEGGLESLLGALQRGNHSRYVESEEALDDARDEGNGILGHIFGGKDVSRAVAAQASEETGIGAGALKQLLPMIASMVMGSMSSRTQQSGLQDILGNVLGGALGGSQSSGQSSGGGLLDSVLGGLLGGGGEAAREVEQRRRDTGRESESLGLDDLFGDLLGGGSQSSGSSRRSGGSSADELLEALMRSTRR